MLGRLLFTDPHVASLLHRTTATLTDAAATSSTVGSSVTEALGTAATVSPATPPSNGSSRRRRRRSSSGRLSFKVSYLVDSCGLTPAAAAVKRISLDTPEGPDAVLALLRAHDFAKSDIAKLVDVSPSLLLHDAEADLRPKLEFYLQLGFSPPALVKFICRNVYALKADLETKIIPYVDFLRAVAGTDGRVVGALRRCPNLLGHNLRSLMESKIECLKCHGVPDSNISMLFVVLARVMVHRTDRFIRAVDKVSEMGYNPSATSFLRAVSLVCGTSTSTWEKKLEVYRSLGWSKAEVILAFKRQPYSMGMSEQKLRKVTRFFKDVFNWGPAFIARYATLLTLSFEKRILPRASVLRLLESRKLLRRKPTATAFYIPDIAFWDLYVEPYQKDVPEVLEAYSETTLRLEALMGDLEDASLSLIGQNVRITLLPYGSDLSCPIVRLVTPLALPLMHLNFLTREWQQH